MGIKLRVLIVEDSEDDALLMVRELRQGGYDPVFERVDTKEAMSKALAEKTWDIVISDYVMPHFSGLEALKVLQRSGLDVPLIIVSGKIGEDVAVEAMRAGARDYVMKNNLTKLIPAVERELREAEVRGERRRALEALRESEARFRNLIESARDIIFTISPEGTITSLNPAFEKITGWSRDEWLGESFKPLVHPDDLPLTMDIFQRVVEGEKPPEVLELRIISRSGEFLTMEISITLLVQNKGVITGLGIARDITERKQMEEALRKSRDELEARVRERTGELARANESLHAEITERIRAEELGKALNNINLIINSTVDFDEIMRRVVVESAKAIGSQTASITLRDDDQWVVRYIYDLPEDLIGTYFTDEDIPHGALAARTKKPVVINDAYSDNRVNRRVVERFGIRSVLVIPLLIREDVIGLLHFNYHSAPIVFSDTQVDFAGKLAISVSLAIQNARLFEERRRTEEKLKRSNAELEQFAYVASHDLQEPLRMVSGFAQLLSRRYRGRLDRDADEFIAYVVDGARRMQQLIEDLLTYSRVSTRTKPFELIDLEAVFNQAVANLKATIEENGTVVTHDPLPSIIADAVQMVQLFQNLIGNAIKFRRDEPPRIQVSARREKDDWVFSVRDNGIGISPEFKSRLFQIFQREHAASRYPGTGIGLATCKKIVERHGGRIWAESVQGEGSTFYFMIPARGGER